MTPEQVRQKLIDIKRKKVAAEDVIDALRPFVEEVTRSGSVMLRRKLNQHHVLMNKIYNSLLEKGTAEQVDVGALKIVLQDLQEITNDIQNYCDAKRAIEEK